MYDLPVVETLLKRVESFNKSEMQPPRERALQINLWTFLESLWCRHFRSFQAANHIVASDAGFSIYSCHRNKIDAQYSFFDALRWPQRFVLAKRKAIQYILYLKRQEQAIGKDRRWLDEHPVRHFKHYAVLSVEVNVVMFYDLPFCFRFSL